MKATGVVRRIDDLGRVVIPKEIRKTLRIKEGDPLEIFTDKEGEVILKKYSPIGELSEFATSYAETIAKTTGHIACITDKDTVIAVSGGSKKEFLEKNLSKELEEVIENKEIFKSKKNAEKDIKNGMIAAFFIVIISIILSFSNRSYGSLHGWAHFPRFPERPPTMLENKHWPE